MSRALLMVIRKGDIHKDRKDVDNQIGCWRHKEYVLCSVFATAAHVVWTLSQNDTINFDHAQKKERAPWWDIPLIDWEEYGGKFNLFVNKNVFH